MSFKNVNNRQKDIVISFMLNEDVKGLLARIDKSLTTILSQRKYPEKVANLIAESVLLAAMIGQAVKLRWKLSLQIHGSGKVKLIVVDYFSPKDEFSNAEVRAFAKFDAAKVNKFNGSAFNLLGEGFFSVVIDQGPGTEPYQGITPFCGDTLASCAEAYFLQSEQLATTFKLIVGQTGINTNKAAWTGGGIMLQRLPRPQNSVKFASGRFLETDVRENLDEPNVDGTFSENWSRVKILMNTVEDLELIGPQILPEEVLKRLFHEEDLRIFNSLVLDFGCSCSIEKVTNTLSIYSKNDIESMTTQEGTVTVDCQYCGQQYVINPRQLDFDQKI